MSPTPPVHLHVSRKPARGLAFALAAAALWTSGCPQPARPRLFTPMRQAVDIVEANRGLIRAGLKARGSVWGHFRDSDGTRRSFILDARLQVVPPDHMRFVMDHALGGEEVEAGMNDRKWWVWVRRSAESYVEGERGTSGPTMGSFPLRAERLMVCLGLAPLNMHAAAQRVVDDYQQIIFMGEGTDERKTVEREIWLDRLEPRLIRCVLYRDDEGRVEMQSQLDAYRSVGGDGLRLPHRMTFDWPDSDARLEFRIDRWTFSDRLTAAHPAFVARGDR